MPSQVIRDFAYDAERNELTVSFASGKVYLYALVPGEVAAAFAEAASPGGYFNTNIRDRYPYRRVRNERPASPLSLREALKASREA